MKEVNTASYSFLADPLSSVGRGARKGVLTYSSIALALSIGKVNIDNFSFAGLKFEALSLVGLQMGLFAVLLYFGLSFFAHVSADHKRFKHLRDTFEGAVASDMENEAMTPPEVKEEQQFYEDEFASLTECVILEKQSPVQTCQ